MTRSDTLKEAADHFYALADLFTQLAGESAAAPVSAARPSAASPPAAAAIPPSFDELPPDEFGEQGSEAICPAHHKPFVDGNYGPYCPGKGIDPAWTNKRGYCTVNPKNVATYLRVKAA
jgi:hypothetical protein